jgi:predicted PurR-regulated permease PerM
MARRTRTMSRVRERLSVFAFAAFLLALFVGLAFAAGYALGKILL